MAGSRKADTRLPPPGRSAHERPSPYPHHDYLMVGPEGRPLHLDTITRRFNRLVDRARVPRIRLHDVRHTYATISQDAGHNVKTLSERIGHADTSVTMKIYTHRSQGVDRPMAQAMAT
jgi:integrase